jgi:hypothetical protein
MIFESLSYGGGKILSADVGGNLAAVVAPIAPVSCVSFVQALVTKHSPVHS